MKTDRGDSIVRSKSPDREQGRRGLSRSRPRRSFSGYICTLAKKVVYVALAAHQIPAERAHTGSISISKTVKYQCMYITASQVLRGVVLGSAVCTRGSAGIGLVSAEWTQRLQLDGP